LLVFVFHQVFGTWGIAVLANFSLSLSLGALPDIIHGFGEILARAAKRCRFVTVP